MNIDKIIHELSRNEKQVLLSLQKLNGSAAPEKVINEGGFSQQVEVMNAASWLQAKKLAMVKEYVKTVYSLDKEGRYFHEQGLPEKRVIRYLNEHGKKASLGDLKEVLKPYEIPIAIGWVKRKGWAQISKENNETILTLTEKGFTAIQDKTDDEKIIDFLAKNPESEIDENKHKPLIKRSNVLKEKEIIIIKPSKK